MRTLSISLSMYSEDDTVWKFNWGGKTSHWSFLKVLGSPFSISFKSAEMTAFLHASWGLGHRSTRQIVSYYRINERISGYNLSMYQNHLQGLLKHILLSPMPRVSDLVGRSQGQEFAFLLVPMWQWCCWLGDHTSKNILLGQPKRASFLKNKILAISFYSYKI